MSSEPLVGKPHCGQKSIWDYFDRLTVDERKLMICQVADCRAALTGHLKFNAKRHLESCHRGVPEIAMMLESFRGARTTSKIGNLRQKVDYMMQKKAELLGEVGISSRFERQTTSDMDDTDWPLNSNSTVELECGPKSVRRRFLGKEEQRERRDEQNRLQVQRYRRAWKKLEKQEVELGLEISRLETLVSTTRRALPSTPMDPVGCDSQRAAFSCVASYVQLYKQLEKIPDRRCDYAGITFTHILDPQEIAFIWSNWRNTSMWSVLGLLRSSLALGNFPEDHIPALMRLYKMVCIHLHYCFDELFGSGCTLEILTNVLLQAECSCFGTLHNLYRHTGREFLQENSQTALVPQPTCSDEIIRDVFSITGTANIDYSFHQKCIARVPRLSIALADPRMLPREVLKFCRYTKTGLTCGREWACDDVTARTFNKNKMFRWTHSWPEIERYAVQYLFLTFRAAFDDAALGVSQCIRSDFVHALSNTRSDTVIVDGFSAAQLFLSSAFFVETFPLRSVAREHCTAPGCTAVCPIIKRMEYVRNVLFVLSGIDELEALLHDWLVGMSTKAETLFVRLDVNVFSYNFVRVIHRFMSAVHQLPTSSCSTRVVFDMESLSEEYFLMDQLYRAFLSQQLFMEIHVIFPSSAETLRLLANFAHRNSLDNLLNGDTASIEQWSNGYVFRTNMPNDGNSVHVSVGVPRMLLDQSTVFSELQKISDAYVAAIFFA